MSHNHVSRETMAQALDGAEHTIETLRAEIERLKRQIETTPPWPDDGKALDDEQMRALMSRWSTGPERYQADADALIATTIRARRELAAANQRAEEAERGLADAHDVLVAMKRERDAAEQLAEDRLRMLDVAVQNAADAAGVERVENLDLLRDLHGTYRRGSAAAAAIRDAIGFVEQRGTHRTGGQ